MSETVLKEAWQSHRAGDHARAEQLYKAVLRREPKNFDALYRLGFLYGQRGRFEEAQYFMGEAIRIKPKSVDAHFLRASALSTLGRLEDALSGFNETLSLAPDFPEPLLNRAAVLFRLRRFAEAADDYDRLLKLDPEYPFALGNRLFCRLHGCDWRSRETDIGAIHAGLGLGRRVVAPFDAKALSLSPDEELRCTNIWVADQAPQAARPLYTGEPYRHDRIRVAYLAASFGDNPVSALIAGVIDRHDRRRFEVTGVSFQPGGRGANEARFRRSFDRFISMAGRGDADIAATLRELEIDIAVDLMGFTEGCRPGIFARRPAPVSVNYLGFPGTMGAPYIDYILADRTVIPDEQQRYYSESVVFLPDSYLCNDSTRAIADATPNRVAAGLPERGLVFVSFNNAYKIAPAMFDVWMRLLHSVEDSVLWLATSNAVAMRNLLGVAQARGIAPHRLVFAPFVPDPADHLARLRLADLFLDTLPYNAHTTAADALWAGVPVLTCIGECFAGRVAASLLHAVGLPEMVTNSLDRYEALALELARNSRTLGALRTKLAAQRSTYPLFDTVRFTRHLEAAFTEMWQRSERRERPASFAVTRNVP